MDAICEDAAWNGEDVKLHVAEEHLESFISNSADLKSRTEVERKGDKRVDQRNTNLLALRYRRKR